MPGHSWLIHGFSHLGWGWNNVYILTHVTIRYIYIHCNIYMILYNIYEMILCIYIYDSICICYNPTRTHTQAPLHPRVVRSSRLYSELRVLSTRLFGFRCQPFRFSFCGVPVFISQFQIAAFSFICDCRLDHVAGH